MAETKTISFEFEDQIYLPLSIQNTESIFYSFCNCNLTKCDYFHKSKNCEDLFTSFEGNLQDETTSEMVCKEEYHHEEIQALSDHNKEAFE